MESNNQTMKPKWTVSIEFEDSDQSGITDTEETFSKRIPLNFLTSNCKKSSTPQQKISTDIISEDIHKMQHHLEDIKSKLFSQTEKICSSQHSKIEDLEEFEERLTEELQVLNSRKKSPAQCSLSCELF